MDEKFAEVLYLADPCKEPHPNGYCDRDAFDSIACKQRFPGIQVQQMMTEAAAHIDSQLEPGGSIRAHWKRLKAGTAQIVDPPRSKRKANLSVNGRVLDGSNQPFYTNDDGTLFDRRGGQTGSSSSSDAGRSCRRHRAS